MDKKEALRQTIRELIKKELDEMSTTGMVAGYLTPMAFRGNKKKPYYSCKIDDYLGVLRS